MYKSSIHWHWLFSIAVLNYQKERIKTESTCPSHRPEPFPDLCSQNSTSAVWHSETSRATSSLVGKGARNFFKTNKSLELITGYYANTTSPRSRSPNHCVASLRPKKILSLFCSKNTCFSGKISSPSIPRGLSTWTQHVSTFASRIGKSAAKSPVLQRDLRRHSVALDLDTVPQFSKRMLCIHEHVNTLYYVYIYI